jgi:SNF2 family DNA or RNA helicase
MKPSAVVLLSGTPTAGKYEKLWSQCKLLGWNITKTEFWNRYVVTTEVDFGMGYPVAIVTGYRNVDDLKQQLRNHGAVFMKTEEVLTLPKQVENIIRVKPSPEYKRFVRDEYIKLQDGSELIGDTALTNTLYARQLCGQYSKDKLQAFRDMLESTEDRLVVFYNFTAEMVELMRMCQDMNRPVSVVNGRTKDLTAYDEHQNSVTFVQYQAGAMGLNLQKAHQVVYFTLPLGKGSCDLWEQSKKRIHRIGQHQTCFYHYLLVDNSIEMKNLQSLRLGKDLTDDLFEESDP